MDAGERILWGIATSRAIRAHWALHELGLSYRTEPIRTRTPLMKDPRFLAVSPRGKIPVLQDGGLTLAESAAIVAWLGTIYRDRAPYLVPPDPAARARYDEWSYFVMTELDATSLYILRRHVDLHAIYGEAPVAVRSAEAYFGRQIGVVERALADGRLFLLGDDFSGADILLTSCLIWAQRCGLPLSAPVEAYRARMVARPAYATARAVCYPPEQPVAASEGQA